MGVRLTLSELAVVCPVVSPSWNCDLSPRRIVLMTEGRCGTARENCLLRNKDWTLLRMMHCGDSSQYLRKLATVNFNSCVLGRGVLRPCWLLENGCVASLINPYAAGGVFSQYKMMQKNWKMVETLANGYSSESTRRELSNEYQHDQVQMFFKNLNILVLWTKVTSELEGLIYHTRHHV